MTTLTLTAKAVHGRVISISFPHISWKVFYAMGIIIAFALVVFYVFTVNELTRGTYITRDYNKQIDTLSQQNRQLETSFAQTDFLGRAIEKAQVLHFEKTTNIKYLQIIESPLAER